MAKVTGFLEFARTERRSMPARRRMQHFGEFIIDLNARELSKQAARCMDCGIPYCHTGCRAAQNMPADWSAHLGKFVKIMPPEYRRALQQRHHAITPPPPRPRPHHG